MFLQGLYRLNLNDVQARLIDPAAASSSSTVAATSIEVSLITVPLDHVLLLHNAIVSAEPDATQTVQNASVRMRDPVSGTDIFIAFEHFTAVNGLDHAVNWSGEVIVPSGWRVLAVGNFNAGVAGNQVVGNFVGVLVPRGNVERI